MFQEVTNQDEGCYGQLHVRIFLFGLGQYLFLAPIANNPDFECTCVDVGFKDWKAAGITKNDHMYLGDALKSFQQLQEEFNLS